MISDKPDKSGKPDKAKGRRQGPRKVSAGYLERAALHYLGRFSTTEANLRAVLERKIRRRNEENAPPTDEQLGWVDAVVAKCVSYGYVDDATYARSRVDTLIRKGKPTRMIAQDLRYKGVPTEIADVTMRAINEDNERDPDRQAAAAYVRRRRFGAFRRADRDVEGKLDKEKAAMMRAGFSYGLVAEMLSLSEDEILDLLP
ncbi:MULTISPECIES: regulatory protein RecX [Kordiimonas]|uniref:regulatory protein RecX n=1 Tax=Kordiimonas TaxID=288021 RepID=UPI00258061AF|nr:RecX family transcriptional regulator [Kordiimonas sp. UBA4487]